MHPNVSNPGNSAHGTAARNASPAGKRVGVPSNLSVKGLPTEAGSLALRGFTAFEDATVVRRLKECGAQPVSWALSRELGLGLCPEDLSRVLGNGQVDFSLMTDTLGEARVAAAVNGVFGFKPSYGMVSRFGLVGVVPSMDCCGFLGKNLDDISAAFRAVRGKDDRDPSMPDPEACAAADPPESLDSPVSVGTIVQCMNGLDSAERTALEKALSRLESLGATVREVEFQGFDLARLVHNVVGSVEASSSCGKFDGVRYGHRASGAKNWNEMYLRSRAESFGTLVKAYLFQGAYFQFQDYPAFENACRIRSGLVRESRRLWEQADLVVLPTRRPGAAPSNPADVGELYDPFSLTLWSNVTGLPSLSLPRLVLHGDSDLGLQLVGPLFGDERLLRVAGQWFQTMEGVR